MSTSHSGSAVTREEFEAALMRQEHRLFRILWNFWNRKQYNKSDARYQAVAEALVYRIVLALAPTATAGGAGLIAIVGLWMTWKANSLVAEQNELIRNQNQK